MRSMDEVNQPQLTLYLPLEKQTSKATARQVKVSDDKNESLSFSQDVSKPASVKLCLDIASFILL